MRTRVKICGITRQEDALAASRAGADALGFVFYQPSPRYVSPGQAAEIVSKLPPFVSLVALFVNPSVELVNEVINNLRPDVLQFHGDEPSTFCEQFAMPWYKAVRVRGANDILQAQQHYSNARALLLDTYVENLPGGTGSTFDWQVIPENITLPIILAGGLNAANVQQAICATRPWAVDTSGGVEQTDENGKPKKGIKSAAEIESFIRGVNSV